jgi:hypothetical protein
VNVSAKNEIQQVFTNRNPRIVSHFGDLELEVRMATVADLPEDVYKDSLYFLSQQASYIPLRFVGTLATTQLSGIGIIGVILGSSIYFYEKGIWDSYTEALINYEFTRAIDKAIEDRLIITFVKERPPNVKIDVVIQSFGLVESSFNMACVTVSADFILSRGGMEVKRDHIEISNGNRSKDAPPPQCAHLKRFAENNARLVKDTLTEYAEVMAVMVIDRIPKGNSK